MENTTKNKIEVKRKRGRPPSKKIDTTPKIAKKRGRKPKIRTQAEIDQEKNKPKRKRGRKAKERIYSLIKDKEEKKFSTDDNSIIINLPINVSNLKKYNESDFIETTLLEYNKNIPEPQPYDPLIRSHELDGDIPGNNEEYHQYENVTIVEGVETAEEHKDIEYNLYEKHQSIKKTVKNIMIEFMKHEQFSDSWMASTDINCWWCCHSFNNAPCAIPIKYVKDIFYVYGCFCSFNCALSYNFTTNVNKKWERVSYLHLLYKKLYNVNEVVLDYAPERQCLKMFGGYMDIEQFRNSKNKTYNVVYPPMICIIPQLQETEIVMDKTNNKIQTHLSDERIQKASDKLKIKRDKPLYKNSIEGLMGMVKTIK